MPSTSRAQEMQTVLDRMEVLLTQLKEEPWAEYDATLTGSCAIIVRRSFEELRKVAKAISRITPEESRASVVVPGFEWVGEALDEAERR